MTAVSPVSHDEIVRRFEAAADRFGSQCASELANEKTFQAWFAAILVQEFGLPQVYREIHLPKDTFATELAETLRPHPIFGRFLKGNELFPDVVVTRGSIDARGAGARHHGDSGYWHSGRTLNQLAVVTELKVTASTHARLRQRAYEDDIRKLGLFLALHALVPDRNPLSGYFIFLDNHRDGAQGECLRFDLLAQQWPNAMPKPRVCVLRPGRPMERWADFRRVQ